MSKTNRVIYGASYEFDGYNEKAINVSDPRGVDQTVVQLDLTILCKTLKNALTLKEILIREELEDMVELWLTTKKLQASVTEVGPASET